MDTCPICKESLANGKETVKITAKGVKGLEYASKTRRETLSVEPNAIVHVICRRHFTDPRRIDNDLKRKGDGIKTGITSVKRRSQAPAFQFKNKCFLCGNDAVLSVEEINPDYKKCNICYPVRTTSFQTLIKNTCVERNDDWGTTVLGRIEYARDLHASDAIYHQMCSVNFRTGRNIPVRFINVEETSASKSTASGRPKDLQRENAFLIVMEDMLANGDEQKTITELVEEMGKIVENPYSTKYMKLKLVETLGDNVIISNVNGRNDVVTFNRKAVEVLQEFYDNPRKNELESDQKRFIKTAAALIRSAIIKKFISHSKEYYPEPNTMKSLDELTNFSPDLLTLFLQELLVGDELKIATMGQCLVQAARPRSILAPFHLGLAVQLHHIYGSRFLLDTLNTYGFCSSYSEVLNFEMNTATQASLTTDTHDGDVLKLDPPNVLTDPPTNIEADTQLDTDDINLSYGLDAINRTDNTFHSDSYKLKPPVLDGCDNKINNAKKARNILDTSMGHFRQYVADNADSNPCTLDGKKSLHAMGMIESITPEIINKALVKRNPKVNRRSLQSMIDIKFYQKPSKNNSINFYKLPPLNVCNPSSKLHLIWKVSWPLKPDRPLWSGTMQVVTTGDHLGKSTIRFLPMIDMDPTNLSCIYSTLLFITDECSRHGCTPVITFDQPLWWKSRTIVNNEPSNSELKRVVLHLGGFHTAMSFLGSIGHLMDSSGLRQILEKIYGENTVGHILSGKAYAKATRGHFLMDSVLSALIFSKAYKLPLSPSRSDEVHIDNDIQEMHELFDKLIQGKISVDDALSRNVNDRVFEQFENEKAGLRNHPTGQLWLQYMDMINLFRNMIRSERTGDWSLHLSVLSEMIPYFAATGHRNYAKSVQIFIQDMVELKVKNPLIYSLFDTGLFVVRRSDRFWAGLPKDLVIEQSLMRPIKSIGGLVHGRGVIDEIQRNRWILSMPACSAINEAMTELSQKDKDSVPHKDCSSTRVKRDNKDGRVLLEYLIENNPFDFSEELCDIASGETASSFVNCYQAYDVGVSILNKMYDCDAYEFSFRKKDEAVTMGQANKINVDGDPVTIDTQLLFQRFITIGNVRTDIDSTEDLLKYELANHPTALFDDCGFIREATKSQLLDVQAPMQSDTHIETNTVVTTVLDGGALLHGHVTWKRDTDTYNTICERYINVIKSYPFPVIVFDGYDQETTTKDTAHHRRSKQKSKTVLNLSGDKVLKSKKEDFLQNGRNKVSLIALLKDKLSALGIAFRQSSGDADYLIAMTAIEASISGTTQVIADDTDILVLLCHHADDKAANLIMKSSRHSSKRPEWNIKHLRRKLTTAICEILPVIHAIGGCDTTSRLFGLGKGVILRKAMTSRQFREYASIYTSPTANSKEIEAAGDKALIILYGGNCNQTLDSLRCLKWSQKVSTSSTQVSVQSLPPTSDGAKFHNFRVYLQVQTWMGNLTLKPEEWGWKMFDNKLIAVKMSKPPAPDALLKVIRCKCKMDCSSKKCTCKKHGLECTSACTECRGVSCVNSTSISEETSDDL